MAPVVIGRPFIDSYVFNYTFTNKEIDTIDGSNASIILIEFAQFLVAAIHQTNEKGNWSGHGSEKNMTKEELKEYQEYVEQTNARNTILIIMVGMHDMFTRKSPSIRPHCWPIINYVCEHTQIRWEDR